MDEGIVGKYNRGLEPSRESLSLDGKVAAVRSNPRMRHKCSFVQSMAIVLVVTLVVGVVLVAFALDGKQNEKDSPAVPLYVIRSPILIESDAQLTAANGVSSGNGTPGNPYVIQGWDIDASGTTTVAMAGIAVANVTSNLVIRHVNVHSGNSSGNSGILLMNVTSCTVECSQSNDNLAGIAAAECGLLVIQNNTVQNCGESGIMVIDTDLALIRHNVVGLGGYTFAEMGLSSPIPSVAIALMNSTGSSVVNNSMSHSATGLSLMMCNQTVVAGNHLYADSVGLSMILCNWTQVHDNQAVESFSNGISMMLCENNTFFDNIIAFTLSDGSMWTGYGAWLFACANNLFYHNDFMNNMMSPQAFEYSMGGVNYWNLSDPLGGNYWSDFSGGTYQIDSSVPTYDYYPLLSEPVIASGPHAFFIVTPASGTNTTEFRFDATPCWLSGTLWRELQYRWDFNGDGSWDTAWLDNNYTQYSYYEPGEYNVVLEVMDEYNRTDNVTGYVEVELLVIPEFPGLLVPMCSMLAAFIVIVQVRNRRQRIRE